MAQAEQSPEPNPIQKEQLEEDFVDGGCVEDLPRLSFKLGPSVSPPAPN